MRRFLALSLAVLTLLLCAPATAYSPAPWRADGPSRGRDLHVYLLTFGVGDEIATWFGHSALMVEDERRHTARVYNYGMFNFGPDLLPKFLIGRLEFWVGEATARGTIAAYKKLDRDIYKSELNLSPQRRREMAAFLAWNILPENRGYLYHHFDDNCATRVRDAINKAVGGQLETATSGPGRATFRGHTARHTEKNPPVDLLLSMWMNDVVDQPITEWQEMFLPGELRTQLEAFEYEGDDGKMVKLVPETEVVFRSDRGVPPQMPGTRWPFALLVGMLLGGCGYLFARKWESTKDRKWRLLMGGHHFVVGLLFGIPGLIAVLFNFSEHDVTWWNENLLLWGPLTTLALFLSFPIMRGKPWALRTMRIVWSVMAATSVLAVALKLLPAFDQSNGLALAMMVPFNILMAIGMRRISPPTRD